MASETEELQKEAQYERGLPGTGLIKGLAVTLKHMLRPAITQQYPRVKPDLPPRTRGVIALKEANCTVCWKCSRECPDWCIYIEAHKETHDPASGGKARSAKILDRFAIDYALCMYCGICVEVCPFDALFWSPEFEYAEYDIHEMTHEKERLEDWTYKVPPPPALEEGAEPPAAEVPAAVGAGSAADRGAPIPTVGAPGAEAEGTAESPAPSAVGTMKTETLAPSVAAQAEAGSVPAEHVEPDQETYDRVLAEEIGKGTDRRVAEGKAKRAAIIAARKKAQGG